MSIRRQLGAGAIDSIVRAGNVPRARRRFGTGGEMLEIPIIVQERMRLCYTCRPSPRLRYSSVGCRALSEPGESPRNRRRRQSIMRSD